jgi:hypothetical protein
MGHSIQVQILGLSLIQTLCSCIHANDGQVQEGEQTSQNGEQDYLLPIGAVMDW